MKVFKPDTDPKKGGSVFERLLSTIDMIRKVLTGSLVIILSIIAISLIFVNSSKRRVIIQPFKVSSTLNGKGYTGEFLTALFIQKIRDIQDSGSSLYHVNKVVIPDKEDKVDEFSIAFSNSIFSEVKSLVQYFGSFNSQTCTGEIMESEGGLMVQISINGAAFRFSGVSNVDSLFSVAAQTALSRIDPYTLSAYYLRRHDNDLSLIIDQRLLNDNNSANDGLANHLRGIAYLQKGDTIKAKGIFLQALKTIRTPWLTYNNLGVIYDHYLLRDSARQMYNQAIKMKPDAYPSYLNFANLLFKEYRSNGNMRELDSAILLYKQAISRDMGEVKLYLALLPALYKKSDTSEAYSCTGKAIEMAPNDYVVYWQIGAILKEAGRKEESLSYFDNARHLCGDSVVAQQIESFSRR